jgi:hypothetical protein
MYIWYDREDALLCWIQVPAATFSQLNFSSYISRYRWWKLTGIHRYNTDIGIISEPILTKSPILVRELTISVVATYGYTLIFTDIRVGVILGAISA